MKVTLTTMGWEITNCPPYSPDSAPSDFNFLGPRKVHLEEQKFQNDDELKGDGCPELAMQSGCKFYAASIITCKDDGKKRVNVNGEYLEKKQNFSDSGTCILSVKKRK
jgi:hypothetical protein